LAPPFERSRRTALFSHTPAIMKICSALLVIVLSAACAAAPRQRPIKLGDVDTGPGSLEQVRRQFAGTWELVSLDLHSAKGETQRVKGSGSLTYDEYGNLKVLGQVREPVADLEPGVLKYEGRAVIDPVKSQLRLLDLKGSGAGGDAASSLVAPSSIRQYRFEGPLLHISIVNERGEPTATTIWKRAAGTGGPSR
jgi:hypothetical protein